MIVLSTTSIPDEDDPSRVEGAVVLLVELRDGVPHPG